MDGQKANEQHYQIGANKTEMMALSERNNAITNSLFPKGKGRGQHMTEIAFQIGQQVRARQGCTEGKEGQCQVPTRKIQDMLVRNMKRRNKTNI
jgi:hypothetical protein